MKTEQMRDQIKAYAEKLSPDQVKLAYEFLAKLAEDESEDATNELLAIPGLMNALEEADRDIVEGNLTDWREVRNDV
ncbi:MAG: hypothetical protein VKK42_20645 [Lyngbya sp.]|nr:hypothetical protein [Lyngbya sp.]